MKLQKVRTENIYLLILIGAAFVSLFLYSYLATNSLFIFNSPDETANFFGTESFNLFNSLGRQESLNEISGGIVHPRSIAVHGDYLVPVSFWGMPVIYGLISKVLGLGFVPFVTPFFSSITLIFFYLFLKKIFSSETAFWSALFLMVLSPYLYFGNRGLFHNVLFVNLLILFLVIAIWRPIGSLEKHATRKTWIYKIGDELWSAIILGLAFWVRPTEFLYLAPILILAAIAFRKKLNSRRFYFGLGIFAVFVVLFFLINKNLYGAWLGSGYLLSRGYELANSVASAASAMRESLMPFGFHPRLILFNIWHYFVGLHPILSLAYLIGALFLAFKFYLKDLTAGERIYFVSWMFLSAVLFVYYGSGVFNDSPEPNAVTPASSYFRYWLPIFVFGLPVALRWILAVLKIFSYRYVVIIMSGLFLAFGITSCASVFLTPGEGLRAVKKNILEYRDVVAKAEAMIVPRSVVIVHKADKIFFPQWPVVLYDNSDGFFDAIAKLRTERQVYYFRPGPSAQERFYIYNKFAERNLVLKRIEFFGKDVLYEIK